MTRPPVLLLTDDSDLAAAKTSRHLALALNRLGYRTLVRDTRLIRWGAQASGQADLVRREAFEVAAVAKWTKLIEDYGIRLVVSLDLHWLISKNLFLDDANISAVHSFWVNDVPDAVPGAPVFALDARELIAAPKVTHHCASEVQAETLRHLGVARIRRYIRGAPAEYLRAESPCQVRDRLGFIGDPTEKTAPLVGRLVQRGWLDAHGSPEAWQRYGVKAQALPPFPQLASLYRRYPALLNLGDDGQLFEAAACGRLSLALDRPGLRGFFAGGEIVTVSDEAELEAAAEEILHNPDAALVAGEKARALASHDHLWEHRLEAALA